MAEEVSFIHEQTLFFDDILDCIPASLYLQPTEEDNKRWMKAFKVYGDWQWVNSQNNRNADKIKEMKENAQKKRKERFNPANDVSMVERIADRKKEMEEEEEEEIAVAVPLTPANCLLLML